MAIGEGFVIDQDLRMFPVVDDVEQVEQILDFGRRIYGGMPDPFAFPFLPVRRIPFGQKDGFLVLGMQPVTENDGDAECFGRWTRMKDVLEFGLGRRVGIHGPILPENGTREQSVPDF
jgi:hypothetical protein